MNNKGQTLMFGIMIGLMIFVAGMLFVNHLKPEVTIARSVLGLDCTNSTISDGNKVSCLAADFAVPYFMLIVLSAVGGAILSRFLL